LFLSDAIHASLADYDGMADLQAGLPSGYADWDSFSQASF